MRYKDVNIVVFIFINVTRNMKSIFMYRVNTLYACISSFHYLPVTHVKQKAIVDCIFLSAPKTPITDPALYGSWLRSRAIITRMEMQLREKSDRAGYGEPSGYPSPRCDLYRENEKETRNVQNA